MFTIKLKRLTGILHTFRKVLGISHRKSHHPLTFVSQQSCLTIRAKSHDTVIAYQEAVGCTADGEFTTSLAELAGFGRPRGSVAFEYQAGQIMAHWQEGGRTINRCLEEQATPKFRAASVALYSNGAELSRTLWQAAALTDPESKRYSIGCVRLRSEDGQIAATDGRQAFVQTGFNLPTGTHLVPATGIKHLTALAQANSISIGLRERWACIRVGTKEGLWSLDIKLMTDGRFPNLDQCFRTVAASDSHLELSENDAQYLNAQLLRLSPDRSKQGPVTLELSSTPTVRVRLRQEEFDRLFGSEVKDGHNCKESGYRVCEIPLVASSFTGATRLSALDHLHLLNAIRLGFRRFHFFGETSPGYCVHESRAYLFAVHNKEFAVGPGHCDGELRSASFERVA